MDIEVTTKDCTSLTDSEIAEMSDLCTSYENGFDIGFLSKQCEEWVLISQARQEEELVGFSFCSLERIGGTPALLIGLAFVGPSNQLSIFKSLIADQYKRVILAFPDEDVLVGIRLGGPGGFLAFEGLQEIIPRKDHKPTGEERAWGRRLAKRFGSEGDIDDRSFVIKGNGNLCGFLDLPKIQDKELPAGVEEFFTTLDTTRGDSLVVFGWAMAEDLAEGKLSYF